MSARKVVCLTIIGGEVDARVAPELGGDAGASQLIKAITRTRDKQQQEGES